MEKKVNVTKLYSAAFNAADEAERKAYGFVTSVWMDDNETEKVEVYLLVPTWARTISGLVDTFGGEDTAYPILANGGARVKYQGACVRPCVLAELTADEVQDELDNWIVEFGETGQVQSWKATGARATAVKAKQSANAFKRSLVNLSPEEKAKRIQEFLDAVS